MYEHNDKRKASQTQPLLVSNFLLVLLLIQSVTAGVGLQLGTPAYSPTKYIPRKGRLQQCAATVGAGVVHCNDHCCVPVAGSGEAGEETLQ